MTRLEIRNLPRDLIRDYLVSELRGVATDDVVCGEGWEVRFATGEPAGVGRFRVAVLFLDVSGPREAEVARFLRLKTMRGGG